MPEFRLEPSATRSELREAHELIDSVHGAPVTLVLGTRLHPTTPGQYSAWMQLVLTWGQDTEDRVLKLDPHTVSRIGKREPLSDIEVIAVLLAQQVRASNQDVTAQVQQLVREVLVERNVLTAHTGDGEDETLSLLLAAHTFTNRTSPELHAPWEGELAIEETARTLYHDIWPLSISRPELRPPLLEFGEVALPLGTPTHITRTTAAGGRTAGTEDSSMSLGARAPRVRGLALELATEVRQRPLPVHDEIGEILFELVQNTEWHAAKWAGGRTGANCRVVAFREYAYETGHLASAEEFDRGFVAYTRALAQSAQSRSERQITRVVLGSITIIDSGVGLARSVALSLDEEHLLSPETEIRYLIAALSKNLKRRRVDLGNIGLARVQQSLTNLGGFMSIRTGTVEILRDFVTRPFEPLLERPRKPPAPLFVDWVPTESEDFIVGPRIGTSVTIVYPVNFEAMA